MAKSSAAELSAAEVSFAPIPKKPTLPCGELSNYRPISNRPFLSKLLERVISVAPIRDFAFYIKYSVLNLHRQFLTSLT